MLHERAERSSYLERLEDLDEITFNDLPVTERDLFVVISNSGRNAYPLEMVMAARKRGYRTIAGVFIIQAVVMGAAEKLVAEGIPRIFSPAPMPRGG